MRNRCLPLAKLTWSITVYANWPENAPSPLITTADPTVNEKGPTQWNLQFQSAINDFPNWRLVVHANNIGPVP